jgi:hypothetical protein
MRNKLFALFNAILLLIAGVSPLFAQETGGTSSSGGGSVSTSTNSSSETATRSTETVVPGMDTNTMILIGIAALAFIILIVALSRRGGKTEVTKTVINDRRV